MSSETKRVPEQQSLFSPVLKWFGFSAIAGAFLVAALNGPRAIADSRVSPTEITLGSTVTLKRGSPLFATPSPTSTYAVQASVGQSLEFLKLSTNGRWALVKSASGQGWVPASWMIAGAGLIAPSQTVAKSGDAAASAVPLIPVPHPEIPWDPKLDRFVITKAGKLFESPSKFAIRFAVLEAEDEVKVEERSANGKWAKIKTTITGEEGWYPLEWVSARRQERIDQPGPWTLELSGLYGTRNYTYGFGGALAFNFLSHGTEKSPRDRFEIVLLGNYFKGFSYSDGASTLTASFFNMAAAARYMVSNSSGFWSGAVEAGAMYQILKTTAQGVQTSVLSSVGIPEVGSSVGFLAGLVGLYSFTPYFATEVGVRFFLSSNSSAMGFLGLAFRFL